MWGEDEAELVPRGGEWWPHKEEHHVSTPARMKNAVDPQSTEDRIGVSTCEVPWMGDADLRR